MKYKGKSNRVSWCSTNSSDNLPCKNMLALSLQEEISNWLVKRNIIGLRALKNKYPAMSITQIFWTRILYRIQTVIEICRNLTVNNFNDGHRVFRGFSAKWNTNKLRWNLNVYICSYILCNASVLEGQLLLVANVRKTPAQVNIENSPYEWVRTSICSI